MAADKIDSSAVYAMFEELKTEMKTVSKRSREILIQAPQVQTDIEVINELTREMKAVMDDVRKPIRTEHRHIIDINSSKIFLSLIFMALTIIGLSYYIGEQRKTIGQYKNNDLKYRYIKMQGQANEESIYRLDKLCQYADSINLIHKQVEKYEELVKEQVEKIERARQNADEADKLEKEKNRIKVHERK
jgi:hypothetical protein